MMSVKTSFLNIGKVRKTITENLTAPIVKAILHVVAIF